jgi:ribosomal protein S18 acetylase RimI-like enzyme
MEWGWSDEFPGLAGVSFDPEPDRSSRLHEWLSQWDGWRCEAEDFVAVGDSVVVLARYTGRGKDSGVAVDTKGAHLWTLRDGRAVRLEVFSSRERALAAAGVGSDPGGEEERARAWRDARNARVCDVIEPWAHGTVVKATERRDYYDLNVVRVEEPPAMSTEELIDVADAALGDLEHRKLEFDDAEVAAALRPEFDRRGWKTEALVWMIHRGPLPPGPALAVEEVPYDAVQALRETWHQEDFPGVDPGDYHRQAREVALACGVRVFALIEDGEPSGYTEAEWRDGSAEITSVYVAPEHRGRGLGTALTRATIKSCDDAEDLWIVADGEGRPRELYARLGFRPVWDSMEFLLPPSAG